MGKVINTLVTILLVLVIAIVFFVGVDYFSSKIGVKKQTLTTQAVVEKRIEKNMVVTKIIDGDTIIANGEIIRLLGIDADEKGEKCYNASKKKLEKILLNKVVDLEYFNEDKDYYGRKLRYVILDGENINLLLVKEGYVIARVSEDPYKQAFVDAERYARENKIGCKWQENWEEKSIDTDNFVIDDNSIIDACDAKKYIGKKAIVEGKVVEIKNITKAIFLNFERPYPNQCFTAVIFASKFSLFPNVYSYKGKLVRVDGIIKEYNGKPEIILEDPNQIQVVS